MSLIICPFEIVRPFKVIGSSVTADEYHLKRITTGIDNSNHLGWLHESGRLFQFQSMDDYVLLDSGIWVKEHEGSLFHVLGTHMCFMGRKSMTLVNMDTLEYKREEL